MLQKAGPSPVRSHSTYSADKASLLEVAVISSIPPAVGEFDVPVLDAILVSAAGLDHETQPGEVGRGAVQVGHGNRDVIQAFDQWLR